MSKTIKVIEERSKSRRGLHHRRMLYLIVDSECNQLKPKVLSARPIKSLYAKGEAREEYIEVPEGYYVLQFDFRRNPKGLIRGDIVIYDWEGTQLGRAVYRKLKVRLVEHVSPQIIELIKCGFRALKLPVKKYAVIGK